MEPDGIRARREALTYPYVNGHRPIGAPCLSSMSFEGTQSEYDRLHGRVFALSWTSEGVRGVRHH